MAQPAGYQIIFLGSDDNRRLQLRKALGVAIADLGLAPSAVLFIEEHEFFSRDRATPQMAIFFGGTAHTNDTLQVAELIEESIVIAPFVSSVNLVHVEIPNQLKQINALELGQDDSGIHRLVSLVLETFRLIRKERRLFISYRRSESQPLANRLYDALDARGFDVFLDVRSVQPAVIFQDALFHSLADCDVIVLIDTPGFCKSEWTMKEVAQANLTNVQILRLNWPGEKEDDIYSLCHLFNLELADFYGNSAGKGGKIKKATLNKICNMVETLRARALAARHNYLVDTFCDYARDLGRAPDVQLERWISIPLASGKNLVVFPAVGVPTSERIHSFFDVINSQKKKTSEIWVIYDNRGIMLNWQSHLDWLDSYLPIKTLRMSTAFNALKALGP